MLITVHITAWLKTWRGNMTKTSKGKRQMGLKVDLLCDNCRKELLRQEKLVYVTLSFCDKELYFCNETCEKEFFAKHINVNEEYTNDVIYAYLDYDLGLNRRNSKN